jgi:hypothetical protein
LFCEGIDVLSEFLDVLRRPAGDLHTCAEADLRRSASDWMTFAASGPGSRRGLNLVLGRPADQKWEEVYWREALANLQARTRPMFETAGLDVPHAADLQNALCEFFKYERARCGGSKPKRRFRPRGGGNLVAPGKSPGRPPGSQGC